jgi:hypothetical protein
LYFVPHSCFDVVVVVAAGWLVVLHLDEVQKISFM